MKPYETSIFISYPFCREAMLDDIIVEQSTTVLFNKNGTFQRKKLDQALNSTSDVIAIDTNRPKTLGLMLARMGYHVFIRRVFRKKDFPTEPGKISSYDHNFIKLVMVGKADDEKISLSAKGIFSDNNVMSKFWTFPEKKVGRAQYRYIRRVAETEKEEKKEAV